MTTKITADNIQADTLETLLTSGAGGPKISSVVVTDSSYTNLDDTAVALEGGYVKLIGSGFASGCQVLLGLTPATSVTFISETEVRAQLPATAAGTYIIYLVNSDGGTAIRVNAVTFSGTPTWVSGSALAGAADTAISIQLTATDATTFALAAGSTLPPGVTLSSGGLLSGTITGITEETVYNFTINAVDSELQDSPRSFAFTVTSGDQYFNLTTLLLPGAATTFVKDASTNNFAVTVAGDTRPNTFNPYLTGWSNYFDGTGDYLTVPANSAFDITSGSTDSFICEAWVNWSTVGANMSIIDNGGLNAVSFSNWLLYLNASSQISIAWGSSGAPGGNIGILPSTTVPLVGQWYHLALVKTNADWSLFINGTRAITYNGLNTAAKSNSTALYIGFGINTGAGGATFAGYISNVRIYKGATASAPYDATSTTITVPTAPLTTITNTSLLTCQSNRFIDNSVNNFAVTRAGDVAVRSFSPFVEPATLNGSAYFDGTGDYLFTPNNSAFDFGTGDFTVELWFNFSSISSIRSLINNYTNSTTGWGIQWRSDTGLYNFFYGDTILVSFVSTPQPSTWNHISVTRSGTSLKMFLNGVQVGSVTNSTNITSGYSLMIGALYASQTGFIQPMHGYISNVRVVKGTALYTTTFTPPTAPLTAVANTSLLTLQTNQPHNNSQFLDSSTNNLLVTRAGNATQGTFSPYSPSGWSNYFDGTGDALSSPTTGDRFNFGTGDFCVEAFVNLNSTAEQYVVGTYDGGNGGWAMYLSPTGSTLTFRNGDASVVSRTFSFAVGTWYHIAVSRSSSTLRFFVNGTQVGADQASYTQNITRNNTNGCAIGRYLLSDNQNGAYVNGYISNVRVVKAAPVYTANFTPSTQPLTAVAGTSLLTCQSPQFVDNSPNRFAITRAGDVRVTNFAPFKAVTQTPTSYSAYFDGTGDYLTVPDNAAIQMSLSDFTIEFWINFSSIASYQSVYDKGYTGAGALLFQTGLGNGRMVIYANGAAIITESGTAPTGTWIHYALVRNGSTLTLYRDGVSSGSATNSTNFNNATNLAIGAGSAAAAGGIGSYSVNGYMSNLRVVKGTAVYTADFIPPTQPLTAIANTSLLTCQSATFVDNSANNFAITAAGNSRPTTVNPFGSTFTNSTGYTASEYSGSMYFDGSGDSLVVPANPLTYFSNLPFTMEAWVYPNASNGIIAGRRAQVAARGFLFAYQSDNTFAFWAGDTDVNNWNVQISSPTAYPLNQWHHVAVTRNGSNVFTLWVNGVSVASATASFAIADDTTNLQIGIIDTAGSPFNGYISDLRIAKGTLLYTSNFVPPAAPVEPVPNTVLLLNGTGAAITDATTKNVLETVGDARISTAVSKFGGSSMYFDGTGDYLRIPASPNFVFGTENFTVEFWLYVNAFGTLGQLFDTRPASTNGAYPLLYLNSDATVRLWLSSADRIISSPIVINTWYHVALSRSSGSTRLFINGVQSGSTYTDSTNYLASDVFIGASFSGGASISNFLNGYIQDLRITKGHARYTSNFTPPATAFQTR